jgi:hypothetical protein
MGHPNWTGCDTHKSHFVGVRTLLPFRNQSLKPQGSRPRPSHKWRTYEANAVVPKYHRVPAGCGIIGVELEPQFTTVFMNLSTTLHQLLVVHWIALHSSSCFPAAVFFVHPCS